MGLCYLNSRYYDAHIGRFLTPDSLDYLDPETINGLNLYAYCGNNPVNYYDPSGHFVITALLVGLLFGLGGIVCNNGNYNVVFRADKQCFRAIREHGFE